MPGCNLHWISQTHMESGSVQVWWSVIDANDEAHNIQTADLPGSGSIWSTWGWTDTSRDPPRWTRSGLSLMNANLETGLSSTRWAKTSTVPSSWTSWPSSVCDTVWGESPSSWHHLWPRLTFQTRCWGLWQWHGWQSDDHAPQAQLHCSGGKLITTNSPDFHNQDNFRIAQSQMDQTRY